MNSRYKLFIYFLLFNLSCNNDYKSLLNEEKIYLFFRESETKLGYIAQSYNINDLSYSHVGIGVIKNSNLFILHILPNGNSKSDLNIDSYEAFFLEGGDIKHGTAIEIKESNHKYKHKLLTMLKGYKNKNIFFDKKFDSCKDENYYCSEFVCEILSELNLFECPKTSIKLNPIDSKFLNKDSLSYYPVDLYFKYDDFKEISELKF